MNRTKLAKISAFVAAFCALMWGTTIASQKSAATMTRAASQFLASLSAQQRDKATFPFEGDERVHWHYLPNEMFPRKGIMIKDLDERQRALAQALLRTGLSSRGYATVNSIVELEDIVKIVDNQGFARDKEQYLFSIFGHPGDQKPWGWRFEGHHISLHFNVVDGKIKGNIASSPTFLGSNPAEVRLDGDKKGLRILADEEDMARALVHALPAEQRKLAVNDSVAPNEILTTNKNEIQALAESGVAYGALSREHRSMLMKVIKSYTDLMEADIAAERVQKLERAGLDKIRFTWLGGIERGEKHYYRVQGPTFLIEFDNAQSNGNHIHSVWRDFNGDFGRDLLREHLASAAH